MGYLYELYSYKPSKMLPLCLKRNNVTKYLVAVIIKNTPLGELEVFGD